MEAYFLKALSKVELSKWSRNQFFLSTAANSSSVLNSKYMTAVAAAHYGYIASGTSIITVFVLYIQGHFDSCCSESFFFLTTIEMGLVDNSILFPIKELALKCIDKYYECQYD